jgi:hypothetical protein
MRKIYLLLLIILSLMLTGNSYGFQNPLKVGNFFQYTYFNFGGQNQYETREVISDTLFGNGITYFKIKRINIAGDVSHSYEFIDTQSLKWFVYNPSCGFADSNGNEMRVNFTLDSGAVFQTCYSKIVTRKGVRDEYLGYQNVSYISYTGFPINFDDQVETYMEFFGFKGSEGYQFVLTLTGAIIDGVTYGNIVSVNQLSTSIPDKFSLQQNYPNPFNPTTKIKFDIPQSVKVSLKVYDVLGREIANLVNSELNAGVYEYTFEGSAFSSGIYFYTLETENFKETKRMLLVK